MIQNNFRNLITKYYENIREIHYMFQEYLRDHEILITVDEQIPTALHIIETFLLAKLQDTELIKETLNVCYEICKIQTELHMMPGRNSLPLWEFKLIPNLWIYHPIISNTQNPPPIDIQEKINKIILVSILVFVSKGVKDDVTIQDIISRLGVEE